MFFIFPKFQSKKSLILKIGYLPGNVAILTKHFCALVKHTKRKSKKIYKTKLTNIKIENQVMCKYRVDPQRAGLILIAELTWSNLGLKEVLKN